MSASTWVRRAAEDRPGVPRGRVGRRVNLAFGVAFCLVLCVGGVSVLLAWMISQEVERGRQRGIEAEAVDRIHSLVHHFVADAQLALQGVPGHGHPPLDDLLQALEREVAAYATLERAQGEELAREELTRLDQLQSLLAQLEAAWTAARETSGPGRPATAADLAQFNRLAHGPVSRVLDELHTLHREKFRRGLDRSRQHMLLISGLYAAFALGGGVLLLLGNRFLSRNLVQPVTRLVEAALRIAGGDLSQRVPEQSGDEVGQLSRAFNLMAERLEAHEADRLHFQGELERQVKERTRALEETAARLRAAQAELVRSERIAVTGQLAAGVTHEIRTPLNSLAINVQLLRRDLARDGPACSHSEALDSLAIVEYEIARINRILEEFVNFARLPVPRAQRVEVGPLLAEILRLLEPQAAEAGVRIEAEWGPGGAAVTGDPDQLREVFLNLGQNALQAMPNGGVLGIRVRRERRWVAIAVSDRGPGVPEAQRELIFHPFFTTRTGGLGLGLAIVRRIVEQHEGHVACEDRPGGGAVFTVRLPAAEPREDD